MLGWPPSRRCALRSRKGTSQACGCEAHPRETKRVSRRIYRTREDARADVFDYIERFYNQQRKHSKQNFLSPTQTFLAHRLHQPSGLIWPSTSLQVFESAMKCRH
ncbi:MAG: IS3 family transposase [Betaproteobacteria bacterium]|nr:IS3 family transposase [Betaproteobacteria bacterium]MBI2288987.1 IS3 family transposase [Betaproteobacteria bacterium]MBI3053587.1 IS3 family transposase [Betaproteobacteria bacterium]